MEGYKDKGTLDSKSQLKNKETPTRKTTGTIIKRSKQETKKEN